MEIITHRGIDYVQGHIPVENNLAEQVEDNISLFFPDATDDYDYWHSAMYYNGQIWEHVPDTKIILYLARDALLLQNKNPDDYYAKCWVNIWPRDQYISYHLHWGVYSGYYVLRDTGTSTLYEWDEHHIHEVPNSTGHFLSIDSKIRHRTTTNTSDTLRIGLAYTLTTEKDMEHEIQHVKRIMHEQGTDGFRTRQFDKKGNLVLRESYFPLKNI